MSRPVFADAARPFSCSICLRLFKTNRSKDRHVKVVHENLGTFECGDCGKTFYNHSKLIRHKMTHTGERPFRCKLCPKRYIQKIGLETHHLDHHAEKRFKCGSCDKAYGREGALEVHLRTHSKTRFECDKCGSSFQYRSDLIKHQGRHSTTQKEIGANVEQSIGGHDSSSASYNLRARGKTPYYRASEEYIWFDEAEDVTESSSSESDESGSDFQDGEDEPSEPSKESGEEEEAARGPNGLHEEEQSSDRVGDNEAPTERVKTKNWVPDAEVYCLDGHPVRDNQFGFNSGGPDGELSAGPCVATGTKLKLVFDVEYRAPD